MNATMTGYYATRPIADTAYHANTEPGEPVEYYDGSSWHQLAAECNRLRRELHAAQVEAAKLTEQVRLLRIKNNLLSQRIVDR